MGDGGFGGDGLGGAGAGQDYVFDPHCTRLGCAYRWIEEAEQVFCPAMRHISLTGKVVGDLPRVRWTFTRMRSARAPSMWSRLQLNKWFDERLSTRAIRVALFDRHIPKSSPLVEWIYTLGSVLLSSSSSRR